MSRKLTCVACDSGFSQLDHVRGCHDEQHSVVHKAGQVGQIACFRQALQAAQTPCKIWQRKLALFKTLRSVDASF